MTDSKSTITTKFVSQIEAFGIKPSTIHRNLSPEKLVEMAVQKNEGILTTTGSLAVKTGKYTGRSPDDRYIVDDDETHDNVDWGKVNHPMPVDRFDKIFNKMKKFVEGKELFVFDGFVGADADNRLAIRVINDHSWQSLFARQLFVRPSATELENHEPEFTVLCINDFEAIPEVDGTSSNVFILINLTKKLVLIGATSYAGEMKKSMFSVMNYLLPKRGVFPMHCSANIGKGGDTALFFGLSGTGKTSLSADQTEC
jgi:phosphoenolpyruvate carboxykinase (ATP)